MITTVIFDLDDTLYDEIDYCRSGFAAVAHHLAAISPSYEHKNIFDALWAEFTTGNHTRTFNAALEKLHIDYDAALIKKLIHTYRTHEPAISLPVESSEVLAQLSTRRRLALLSDGYLPAQQLKVRSLGLEKYFACIIYTEQLGRQYWKPHPAGFERLLTQVRAAPADCVYVADNAEKDFIAPNKLGMSSVQILRENRIHKSEPTTANGRPVKVIHSLCELPSFLGSL